MKNLRIEALLIAISIISLGYFIYASVDNIRNKERFVSVKGLAEREVIADRVIMPIYFTDMSNELSNLYDNIAIKNKKIIQFLKSQGIEDSEISMSAPIVEDWDDNRYSDRIQPFRYHSKSTITVVSSKVDLIRKIMLNQQELLKQGIAVSQGEYSNNTSFEFTKLNDIKPSMIEEATKNAREAANKFAKDSDSKLGKIKTANQGQFSVSTRDENSPHIKLVRVVSTIDFYLED